VGGKGIGRDSGGRVKSQVEGGKNREEPANGQFVNFLLQNLERNVFEKNEKVENREKAEGQGRGKQLKKVGGETTQENASSGKRCKKSTRGFSRAESGGALK